MLTRQAVEVSPPPNEGEGIPTRDIQQPVPYDSEDEGKDDQMVSEAICLFAIPMKIIVPKYGAQVEVDTLIDSGCTRCLISWQTVLKLGIRAKKKTCPGP